MPHSVLPEQRPRSRVKSFRAVALLVALLPAACASPRAVGTDEEVRELEVEATAYNSLASQTNEQPRLTAWGDRLKPGMKAIAVSRDLIALGLGHGTEVEISGLPGVYVVRDKMARRWRQKIDIYMGEDRHAARQWGRRTVTIRWHSGR